MPHKKRKRAPKFNSTAYYIEEVVGYHSKYEAGECVENGYPPVVAEMLLAILISVRAIRYGLFFFLGLLAAFALKFFLVL